MILKRFTLVILLSILSPNYGLAQDGFAMLPFYVGVMGGYGSTTWDGLVPAQENQNIALNLSTPVEVNEGGGVWGVLIGKELFPNFALEANYMRYPNATIIFDSLSLFSFTNDEKTQFTTHTETASIMGKILLSIPNTDWRIFSSIGVAELHRKDMLNDAWHLTPTFGAGINVRLSRHIMGELVGNYTAGYGEPQLNPTEEYFPFLYSLTLRLSYCF